MAAWCSTTSSTSSMLARPPNRVSTASSWFAPARAGTPARCHRLRWCARSNNGSRAPSSCRARSPTARALLLALGADLAYMGTRFIATEEANADPTYKKALTAHAAHDIVYSNLFTGVHGNYLGPSIVAAGLDPDNLPVADKSKVNFGSGGNMKVKAWRDIWGSGQGIGQIADAPPVAELVERLKAEFADASGDFLKRARA